MSTEEVYTFSRYLAQMHSTQQGFNWWNKVKNTVFDLRGVLKSVDETLKYLDQREVDSLLLAGCLDFKHQTSS